MAKVKVNSGMVFERHEKKFMVTPGKYPILLAALDEHMRQDRFGLHTISTVYCDTDDFAIIRHSLDKPKFKEKLRLRSYGTPGEDDTVYLELKKKLSGVTYKRRIALPLWQARDYLQCGTVPDGGDRQILGEIDRFIKQYTLTAKVLLSYDRIAFYGREDADFRITFDAAIRWRDQRLDLGRGGQGELLLPPDGDQNAVAGAFSLVRFRSAPGTAKEIVSIFFAMAVGLAAGMGYLVYAGLFTIVMSLVMLLLATLRFGEYDAAVKNLKITIPESADYSHLFDDLFQRYASSSTLERVRTTNLGGLYELQYTVKLKSLDEEKELLDLIRQRNGNLNLSCGRMVGSKNEL